MAYPKIDKTEKISVEFEMIPLNFEGTDLYENEEYLFDDEYSINTIESLGLEWKKIGTCNDNSIFEITGCYFEIEYLYYKNYYQGISFEEYLDSLS